MKRSKTDAGNNKNNEGGGQRASLVVETLPLSRLKPHPKNPRKHPEPGSPDWLRLKKSLAHDYFDPIVWNKRNGLLVSGHLRRKVLLDSNYTEADCVVVDYDEKTHLARMVAANQNTGRDDSGALRNLFEELNTSGLDVELSGFAADDVAELLKTPEPESDELPPDAIGGEKSVFELKHNVFFASTNDDGIPDLLPDKLFDPPENITTLERQMSAEELANPTHFFNFDNGWHGKLGWERSKTILGFYTFDDRFEKVWFQAAQEAEKLLAQKWMALVTPNFSMVKGEPAVLQKWNTYRARWCGRYWQEIGYRVIPDVNLGAGENFRLLGIPKNAPCISVECQTSNDLARRAEEREKLIHCCQSLAPRKLLMYGAPASYVMEVAELVPDIKCIRVESQNQAFNRNRKTKQHGQ